MNDTGSIDVEPLKGLVDHGFDAFFRHAWVMFQLQCIDSISLALMANRTNEAACSAYPRITGLEGGNLRRQVER